MRRAFFFSEGRQHAAIESIEGLRRTVRTHSTGSDFHGRRRLCQGPPEEQARRDGGRRTARRTRHTRADSRAAHGGKRRRPVRGRDEGRYGGPAGRWRADHVCILASGPSLTKSDVEHVRNWREAWKSDSPPEAGEPARRVIVINTTYQAAPWADVLYACDEVWWIRYFSDVAVRFRGELWTVSEGARDRFSLQWILGRDMGGLSPDATLIHTGKNSGYQAIGLAHLFGASRIVLLGYDMQATHGRSHWHGDHPAGLGNGRRRYAGWVEAMNQLAIGLKRAGVEVVNATRETALRCFPRIGLGEALPVERTTSGSQ